MPIELAPYIDEDNFAKSRLYNIDKSNYGFFRELFGLLHKSVRNWLILAAVTITNFCYPFM